VEEFRRHTRGTSAEQDALDEFDRVEIGALRSFVTATATTRPGLLLLEEFYEPTSGHPRIKQSFSDLIATMLAARAEVNGRVLLNRTEGAHIAASLERTGKELLSAGLPRFAEQAFGQAADIHARFRDAQGEDRCRYFRLNARRRTYPWWHPIRFALSLSQWSVGYGYRPMRLLIWIAVAIAGFSVYLLHLPRNPGVTRSDALFVTLQNFVNPMGLGDAKAISSKWEAPLALETYTADILRNALFILLIRKWFRF